MDFTEHRKFVFPLCEAVVVLVRRTNIRCLTIKSLVLVAGVIVGLAVNINVGFHARGEPSPVRIGPVAERVLH